MKALISSLGLTVMILGGMAGAGMIAAAARSREREASLDVYRQHIGHCATCQKAGMTPEALASANGHIPSWVRPPDPPRPVAASRSPANRRFLSELADHRPDLEQVAP